MSTVRDSIVPANRARQEFSLVQERKAIQAMVESQMRKSGYYELRGVSCDFHEGVLTLRGTVDSYYLKQLAQSLVFHLKGVQELSNRLEVIESPPYA